MLFSTEERAFEQIEGRVRLTDTQLASWTEAIADRIGWCAARNARYVLMIAPEKHVVYADKLPDGMAVSPERPAMQIVQTLPHDQRDRVIYPLAGLRARRKLAETYHQTASLWTEYGAYTAYLDVLEALRPRLAIEALTEQDLTRRPGRMVGDLALGAGRDAAEAVIHIGHPREQAFARVPCDPAALAGRVEVFETDDRSLPRAVVFADGSVKAMLSFLCPHFSRVVVVGSTTFVAELIDAETPDVVITIMRERAIAASGAANPGLNPAPTPSAASVAPQSDLSIDFGASGNARTYIADGWSGQEPEHRWTIGAASALTIATPFAIGDYEIRLDLKPCVFPPDAARQRLTVQANGVKLAEWELADRATLTCALPAAALRDGHPLELRFDHPDFVNPSALGRNADDRPLAFCFFQLALHPARP